METVLLSKEDAENALAAKHSILDWALLGARVAVERVRYTMLLGGRKQLADKLFFRMAKTKAQALKCLLRAIMA